MKGYIITVAVVAVSAALTDIIAPKEWSKYIKVIIGFLVLSVIVAPIAKFKKINIPSSLDTYNVSDEPLKDKVSKTLGNNIEKDIEERILDEFGIEVEAKVKIETDEKHNIKGVNAIEIKTRKNPTGMIDRLRNIYGCEQIEIRLK